MRRATPAPYEALAQHRGRIERPLDAVLELANASACAAGAPLDVIHLIAAIVNVDPAAGQALLGFDDSDFAVLAEFARQSLLEMTGPVVVAPRLPWTLRAIAAWRAANATGVATIEGLLQAIVHLDRADRRPVTALAGGRSA